MKDIPGYEGFYKITKTGKVFSCERAVVSNSKILGKHIRHYKSVCLKPSTKKVGYKYVILCKNEKKCSVSIHRLVALTYIPNPLNLREVNHKDGNKKNNNVKNLEWCSAEQNNQHAIDNNLYLYGEKHPNSTISDKTVRKIKELGKKKYQPREISKILGVRRQYISAILLGQFRKNT